MFIAPHLQGLFVLNAIETYKIIYGNGPGYIKHFMEVEENSLS